MLKKILCLPFALLFFISAASHAELKVAVIDMERALLSSEAARVSSEEFKQQVAGDLEKFRELEQAYKALVDKSKKSVDLISAEEKRKLSNEIREKQEELKFYGEQVQRAQKQWERDFLRENLPKVEAKLKEILDSEQYDLVLPRTTVMYVNPTHDITNKLLAKLNES